MDQPTADQGAHLVDALLPPAVALKAEEVGAQKTRASALKLLVLAVLAGAFIGLGAMFSTTVLAGAQGMMALGLARLLGGVAFSLGLVLVVVGGAELFTGNALMVMALAAGRIHLGEMLRAWAIVYVGNFIGAAGCALLVFLSGQYLLGDGTVALVALQTATAKATLPFDRALFSGILANVLVCLAVWLALGAHSTTDKILAIVFPISAFVAAGFEHSIANMYLLTEGLLIKDYAPHEFVAKLTGLPELDGLDWPLLARNLVPVTIGNIIGGGMLVGLVYWFVYLRPRKA
jgi:formate/nitrite transporter